MYYPELFSVCAEVPRSLPITLVVSLLVLCPPEASQAIDIVPIFDGVQSESPSFDPNGTVLQQIFDQAESYYEDIFEDEAANTTVSINYWYEDLSGLLGLHDLSAQGGTPNRETAATIRINTRVGSGGGPEQNYFFDTSPGDDDEFDIQPILFDDLTSLQQSAFFSGSVPPMFEVGYQGPANTGPAQNATDMLTLVLHEVGHALGMSASNNATVAETADGDYDLDPLLVGGATIGMQHASGNNIAHLSNSFASLFPTIPTGSRRMPSMSDLLAMASGHSYAEVDLPRKDFLADATNDWEPSRWTGNRNPDNEDEAFIRSASANPVVNLIGPSQAKSLFIGEADQLMTGSHALDVNEQITLDGQGSALVLNAAGSITADSIRVADGAHLAISAGLATANNVTLLAGGQIELSGGQFQMGQLDLTGGTLSMTGGSLHAATVEGSFDILGGRFSPGLTPGQTVIQGNYSQNSMATLGIELNGDVAGTDFDQLLISGTASLAGTLDITTGFTPAVGASPGVIGQTFVILTHGGATGTFTTTTGRLTGSGIFFDVNYSANDVMLGAWQALPGDVDGDRDVDITDFNFLSVHFEPSGTQRSWDEADFDSDGDVDVTDFEAFAANFLPGGYGGSQLLTAVPEPTAPLATLSALLLLIVYSEIRSKSQRHSV